MKSSAGWEAAWSASRSVLDLCPKTEKQCAALSLGMALLFLWKPNTLLFCFKRKCCPLNQFSSKFLQNHLFPSGNLHLRHAKAARRLGLRAAFAVPQIDNISVPWSKLLHRLPKRQPFQRRILAAVHRHIRLTSSILAAFRKRQGGLGSFQRLCRLCGHGKERRPGSEKGR